jgi:hypothetical protein
LEVFGMLFIGPRRCVLRVRLALFAGTLALACGPGVAVGQLGVSRIAAAHLYWSNGRIFEANLNGAHTTAITKGRHNPDGMAVGGGHLYWVDIGKLGNSGYYSGTGAIVEANLNGTHAKTIARLQYNRDTSHGLPIAVSVAVGDHHLYWADNNRIVEAGLDGTHAKTIATGQYDPLGLAAGGGHLYWGLAGTAYVTISGVVYWSGATVVEANLDGTGAKTVAEVKGFPTSIAVGGGHLYWADGNKIVQANPDGTDAKTILGNGSGFSGVLAVGDGHLYWAAGNRIVQAGLDGTGAKPIVKRQGPAGLAVGP